MPGLDEATTRKELIDPALKKAGWDVNNPDQVRIEIPVDGFDSEAWHGLETRLKRLRQQGVPYDAELPAGVCDYALYRLSTCNDNSPKSSTNLNGSAPSSEKPSTRRSFCLVRCWAARFGGSCEA